MIDILNKNSINLTNKFGFTLAEVLITLGIVGVVAAMTIPNVVKNYKAIVLRSQLNKAYSSFAQATQMILTQEFDNTNQFENISVSEFLIYLQKYMKKAVKCDRYEKCPKNIFPSERNATLGVNFIAMNYKTYTGNKMNISDISDAAIVLQDSTFAVVDGDTTKYITIDTNGWKKGPNKLGHDFFMFQIVNGTLKPMGTQGTRYNICSRISTDVTNGRGCTAKALSDKNYFKNLP